MSESLNYLFTTTKYACFDRVNSEIYEQLQNTSSLLRAKKNFRSISLSNVLVQVHFSAFPRLRLCCVLKW